MSWHFSQAQVEESSVDIYSDGKQFAQLKTNPMPSAYCYSDKMTRFSRLSRFGMTFAPLMEDRGEELLTLCQAAFHAKTLAQPAREKESKVQDQDSGAKWQESLGKLNPNGSLQKTHQCLFPEDSISSSPILPKWGLMRDGELWEQTISEQITGENGSGLSQEMWPTPTVVCIKGGEQSSRVEKTAKGSYILRKKNKPHMTYGAKLSDAILFEEKQKLRDSVKMWPTPTATEARQGYQDRTRGKKGTQKSLTTEVIDKEGGREKTGGQLCPIFVEYLMGWPLGHTDLKPLETDKYQQWLKLHGKY